MGSHGGVLEPPIAARLPVATLLSGPAAGVAGAVALAGRAGIERILSFDMGGTSTDVALCEGRAPMTASGEIDGLPVGYPMVDVHTIGAGGGSIVALDAAGALRVGPRSAGAEPGPACYGRGGVAPTVTDAQVVLGRLPSGVPLAAGLQLDAERAAAALAPLAERAGRSQRQIALAVLAVAEAHMERALRRVSVERGRDPADAVLLPFGGAGPLHACALAESLGMNRVLVPAHPGTLSAAGLLLSPRASTASRTVLGGAAGMGHAAVWRELAQRAVATLDRAAIGGPLGHVPRTTHSADVRYHGQSATLPVDWPTAEDGSLLDGAPALRRIGADFARAHQRHYGYRSDAPIEVVTLRLRATLPALAADLPVLREERELAARMTLVTLEDGREEQVKLLSAAQIGATLRGPAVLWHGDATTWLAPGWSARRIEGADLLLERGDA
jgi:N-methylhydantoinase A